MKNLTTKSVLMKTKRDWNKQAKQAGIPPEMVAKVNQKFDREIRPVVVKKVGCK